jgi:hypothetical protein
MNEIRNNPACQKMTLTDNLTMSATEIIEQIKELPANERAQVTKFVVEHDDSRVPESIRQGTADAAFAKWRGRGHLPAGTNADDYLRLTRDANGS